MTTTAVPSHPMSVTTMKDLERQYRTRLPQNTYAVIRVDGKGFSQYTKNLQKPFDAQFTRDMCETAKFLAEQVEGALFAYTQSDEISLIIADVASEATQLWFGGQVQKIVSTTAALATAKFNSLRPDGPLAVFDGRTHHLEGPEGVLEYLQWRQTDAIKNSVSMLASHHFSHRQLTGVPVHVRKQMLREVHGIEWDDLDPAWQVGSFVRRQPRQHTVTYFHPGENQHKTVDCIRREWTLSEAPAFDDLAVLGLDQA